MTNQAAAGLLAEKEKGGMKIDAFKTFLVQSGAEILEPTNEYELVRFRTKNGVSVVYTGKRGISYTGEAWEAFDRFQQKSIWQIQRRGKKAFDKLKAEIINRDGPNCFYCGCETFEGHNRTMEHLLSISHGGNNNLANLTVACQPCNVAVGNMTVVQKFMYRENLRIEQ